MRIIPAQNLPVILQIMPAPSLWSSKYELGIATIDHQHQSLFQLLDDLKSITIRQDQDSIHFHLTLSLFRQWADRHFASEETVMTIIGFSDAHEHSIQHQDFLRRIEDASFSIRQNGDFLAAVEKLADYVATWLDAHILIEDKKWATHLKTHFVRRDAA